MSVDLVVVFARYLILATCLSWVAALCAGAAIRKGEGAAAAAVRIVGTLLIPGTAFAFVGLFFWPVALGVSLLAAWWQGVGSLGYLADRLHAVWRGLSLVSKVAIITLAIAASFRAGAALSMPPTDGDSLLYHLPMTAALLQDHSMWFTRVLLYPGASELGGALGGAAVGNVNGSAALQLVEILALALVAFGWARRAGTGLDGAAAAAVVAGSLPMVTDQMFTSQNDIFVCTMLAAACALWRPSPRLAAVSLGLVFAAKLTALFFVPAIAVVMTAFEGWPFSIADVAWAASIAAPWYVRTWILSGSPLYTVQALGWSSTIAANFGRAWPLVVKALRVYGGLAALGGVLALVGLTAFRGRTTFVRAIPWLALASFIVWIVLPTSAENASGTLNQIQNGWSLRYALLLPFILATALPIALDRIPRFPLAAFVALVAGTSAIVRSANLTGSNEPLGFVFAVPVLVALGFMAAGLVLTRVQGAVSAGKVSAGAASFGAALVAWSAAATVGSKSVDRLWEPSYLQWTATIPATTILLDKHVEASARIAVIGMRSFPLVGPTFGRRTYDSVITQPVQAWLATLRRDGVDLLVASGGSRSPEDLLQPQAEEIAMAQMPGVCKLATHAYVRVYGLTPAACE